MLVISRLMSVVSGVADVADVADVANEIPVLLIWQYPL